MATIGKWCRHVAYTRTPPRIVKGCREASTRLVVVEGNIGVGKTTLSSALARLPGIKVYHEPAPDTPYLAKFYQEPAKYALKLQLLLFRQRWFLYSEAMKHLSNNDCVVVLDRSVYSDSVFANVVHHDGFIDDKGYSYYCELRRACLQLLLPPHAVVYLHVDASVCLDRVRQRSRAYEVGLQQSYLERLADQYNVYLKDMAESFGSRVLLYDWSQSMIGGFNQVVDDVSSLDRLPWNDETLRDHMTRCGDLNAAYESVEQDLFSMRPHLPDDDVDG